MIENKEKSEKIVEDKNILFVINVFLLFFLFSSCINQSEMIEFKPVIYSDNSQIVVDQKPVEKDFYKNLIIVLTYYNVEYSVRDEKVFIKDDIYKDKELMMNYTAKAVDKQWLERIQKAHE